MTSDAWTRLDARALQREEDDRRRAAYRDTSSDGEAARALGMNLTTFRAWRRLRSLPRKVSPGHHVLDEDEEDRRTRAYEMSETDNGAARMLGVAKITFRMWRRSRGLDPKAEKHGREAAREAVAAADLSHPFCECGNLVMPNRPHRCARTR